LFLYVAALGPQRAAASDRSQAAAAVHCSDPAVKAVTSQVVPASGANASYCQVDILFGTSPAQNINIRVGLPLNAADGGAGGVQGAWNGRTQGIGGGGCAGNLNVTAPVNAGYVGSGDDLGHAGGNCEPGVNADGTYNLQFIQDFIRNGAPIAPAKLNQATASAVGACDAADGVTDGIHGGDDHR
jgi:hypothetical protein